MGLRHRSHGGRDAQLAAGGANGLAALHKWPPVLRSRCRTTASTLLILRSRVAPCMYYRVKLWRPSKNGANMTAAQVRAAKLISVIRMEEAHTSSFKDHSAKQDVMLTKLDLLPGDRFCRIAYARHYVRQATAVDTAALYARNDPCATALAGELPAAYAPDLLGAAVWQGLQASDTWHRFAQTCHETATTQYIRPTATPTSTCCARNGGQLH